MLNRNLIETRNENKGQTKVIREYDVLRVITILIVVLGHSDFLYSNDFTVCDVISDTLPGFVIEYKTLRPWIYSFHMPLFVLLSGALFSITYSKYTLKSYFESRIKRLMLPYIACGVLFSIPIKWFVGYFGNHGIIYAYARSLVAMISPGHLWFLWVAFVLNVVFFVLAKYGFLEKVGGVLLACIALNLLSIYRVEWFQLYRLCEYPLYFYLGYLFEKYEVRRRLCVTVMQLKRWKETLLLCGIFLVTVLFVAMSELLDMSVLYAHIFAIIQALAGSMLIYLFSVVLSYRTAIMDTRLFKTLERRNFSIYLYHEPLQFLLLWIFSMIGVLPIFNSNLMYLLLCLVRFLSTIAVSALIGWAVDKIKHRVTLK